MQITERMNQSVGLPLHGLDHVRMAVSDERDAEPRGQIHVEVSVCVDDIRAPGFGPDDRIVTRSGLLFATSAARREGRALGCGETLDPCAAGGGRDRLLDAGERVAESHSAVLARALRSER